MGGFVSDYKSLQELPCGELKAKFDVVASYENGTGQRDFDTLPGPYQIKAAFMSDEERNQEMRNIEEAGRHNSCVLTSKP